MFSLSYHRAGKVLLARFSEVFTPQDILDLDATTRSFIAREGAVRGILDFSETTTLAVPQTLLVQRGRQAQLAPGQARIYVVPREDFRQVALAYATQQRDFGNMQPVVVGALSEALALLGLDEVDFQPIERPGGER